MVSLASLRAFAAEPPTPLSFHATVLNGTTVGSGFLIADGVVVTNAHVLSGRSPGDKVILVAPGQRQTIVRILAISARIDLALITVERGFLPMPSTMPADDAKGAQIIAVGVAANDGNTQNRMMIRGSVNSDPLTLSAYGRGVVATMPRVSKGFSGGPVFDTQGRLIGMIAALRDVSESGRRSREAFILSADEIRHEVRRLQLISKVTMSETQN